MFDANAALGHFHPSERPNYEDFLHHPGAYYVLEHEGAVLGAGGWAREESESMASLCWGLIAPDFQRRGLGRLLTMYRLREIGKVPGVTMVRLDTSQNSVGFYEKQGFRVVAVKKDGYAPGLDRIEMVKRLEVCSA